MSFKLNCRYYLLIFFEEDTNSYLKIYLVKVLVEELKNLSKKSNLYSKITKASILYESQVT